MTLEDDTWVVMYTWHKNDYCGGVFSSEALAEDYTKKLDGRGYPHVSSAWIVEMEVDNEEY